jgi:translation elongation factor EF-Tu-like GTPase
MMTRPEFPPGFEPHAAVEISFLTTEEGGRTGPCRPGYSPPFFYDGAHWIAFYAFDTSEPIQPGETVRAFVCFLDPDAHRGRLFPGKEFELREGSHIVARGRVTKLLGLEEGDDEGG